MKHLAHHFLVALPVVDDENFRQSVTYIVEHSTDGTMGIVINRPIEGYHLTDLAEQFAKSENPKHFDETPLLNGGPIDNDRGFILHNDSSIWDSTLQSHDGISLTTSKDFLSALFDGKIETPNLVALGYAGWERGQLEQEILEGNWLLLPASDDLIFDVPVEHRYTEALRRLGVDAGRLTPDIGHA